MASIEKVPKAEVPTEGKEKPKIPGKVYVDSSNTPDEVVRLDAEGVEILFLHGEGRFLKLEEGIIRGLSAKNKTSYNLSADLDAHSGGPGDDYAGRLAIGEMRDRRSAFEKERIATPMEMEATRKLQMYGPPRTHMRAVRPDRLEHYVEHGYAVVKADDKEFAVPGAKVVENHYEVKDPRGATDLVYVAISQEDRAKFQEIKTNLANQRVAAVEAGQNELKKLGGEPFTKAKDGLAWSDR